MAAWRRALATAVTQARRTGAGRRPRVRWAGRRRAAASFDLDHAHMRMLVDTVAEGLWCVDLEGRCTFVNRAACDMLGWEPADMLGIIAHDLVHHSHADGSPYPVEDCPISRTSRTGQGCRLEDEVLWRRDGTCFPASHASVPILQEGVVVGAVVTFTDITERKRAQAGLHRQAQVFNLIRDAVLITDRDGIVLDCNQAALSLTGRARENLVGRLANAPSDEQAAQDRTKLVRAHLHRHDVWSSDVPVRHVDGSWRVVETKAVAMRGPDGAMTGVISVNRDVTDARRAEEALREGEERFRLAFDRAPIGMAMASLDPAHSGRLIRVNDALCRMLGHRPEELRRLTFIDITHPDDRAADHAAVAKWLAGTDEAVSYEKRYLHAQGHVVHALVTSGIFRDSAGAPRYTVTQIVDISDHRAEAERLSALASHDELTGLANRALLTDRLSQAISRAQRLDRHLAVLFCDLDEFKAVNDTYGHLAGDELLSQVATRVRGAVRPGDTVARFGGDEFVVLCEDLVGERDAAALVDRVITALLDPFQLSIGEVSVGCSVGFATGHGEKLSAADLIAQADKQMYAKKQTTRSSTQ
jgi:diguanylate cyclase (GGDEF)-like protein/PAS domain S-box-containing protein